MPYSEDEKKVIAQIDWYAWFHRAGLPPVLPELDTSMSCDSQNLASL